MKKLILAVAAASLFFVSCNQTKVAGETKDNTAMQKNIDADNAINKAFETGDASKLDNFIAPDFIDHTGRGDVKGVDSLKSTIKWMHENLKDMKMDMKHQLADDEYVADWGRYYGNNPKANEEMPAGPFDIQGMDVTRFKDGKAVEHWGFLYSKDVEKAIQYRMQSMHGKNMNDSTKHQ